jgi:hypothetical protein
MNMTMKELLVKLQERDVFTTYEGDDALYINTGVLYIDGDVVGGFDISEADITSADFNEWSGNVTTQNEENFDLASYSLIENEVVSVSYYEEVEL